MRFNVREHTYHEGVDSMVTNGFNTLVSASAGELALARGWYPTANVHAASIGEIGGHAGQVAELVGAGVLAAPSPGISWERNLLEAYTLASGDWNRENFTAYGANLSKAAAIMRTGEVAVHLGGPKTNAFAGAIFDPHGDNTAVVDRHIWSAFGVVHGQANAHVYEAADDAVEQLADMIGEEKHVTQALVWLIQRRKVRR